MIATVEVAYVDVIANVIQDMCSCLSKQRDRLAYTYGESNKFLWNIMYQATRRHISGDSNHCGLRPANLKYGGLWYFCYGQSINYFKSVLFQWFGMFNVAKWQLRYDLLVVVVDVEIPAFGMWVRNPVISSRKMENKYMLTFGR
jgi:hypothetical protein